jgi:hypothetical protein
MGAGWFYNFDFHNIKLNDTVNSLTSTFLIHSKHHQKIMYVRLFCSSLLDVYASKEVY